MVAVSRQARLDNAREVLRRFGRDGAETRETTPGHAARSAKAKHDYALRARTVQELVDLGEAEWVEPGKRARLKEVGDGR